MLEAILIIFLSQLTGEACVRLLSLPVPGPVVGMAFLFIGFLARGRISESAAPVQEIPVGKVATFLLAHLSLLFVPAGVGVVAHLSTLSKHGLGLIIALVVSTVLSLAVTALVFAALSRRFDMSEEP